MHDAAHVCFISTLIVTPYQATPVLCFDVYKSLAIIFLCKQLPRVN